MRRLIWILLILGILWCAWWALFAFGLKSGLESWFDQQRSNGWQAEHSTINMRGFPLRVRADMTDIALGDPVAGLALTLPSLRIGAPTYWPGDVQVDLPDTPILIATPNQKIQITVQTGHADLRLHPGSALELEQLSLRTGAWNTQSPAGALLSAENLTLAMTQNADDANTYQFSARADGLSPRAVPRAKLHLSADWPMRFETLDLDGIVTFSRPWDLAAIEGNRPQPRVIKLKLAEAAWHDMRLFFAADLVVDATGIPTGTLNIQAENWGTMLALAQSSGLLTPSIRAQVQQGLNQLAQLSGDPKALDVQLNFKSGYMAVGIIPIGPAPRLILR